MELSAYLTFAALENHHFWFVSRRRIFFDLLDRALRGRTDLDVLEVGCGTGGMLGPLQRYGEVSGIDVAHDFVAYCRKRGFRRVLTGSGYELPFADQSFDLVAMFDTIEHIPDDTRALGEAMRVLRPGGVAFVSAPAYQFLWSQNDEIAHHCRRYTARRLRRAMADAGLRVLRASYFNTLLFPLIVPAVLLQKLLERLGGLPKDYNNASVPMPRPLNRLFTWVMSSERYLLRAIGLPFGHSVLALAERPAAVTSAEPERRPTRAGSVASGSGSSAHPG
jgi:SAM-dependent methyltransferase